MIAVFRHELSSYFSGLTAYVFGAFLLLFAGLYTMAYNLNSAVTNFEYVLGGMSFVFLVAIPVLTMRVLAEERRQKTDQLLYALPITMTQVVLGKYLAMLVILLVPLAIICLYPIVLGMYGNVWLPASYSAVTGFFFLGAALIAIGMYVSSITDSQAVAAGVCFVVMLVNYYISDLAGFIPSTAQASLFACTVVGLLAGGGVWMMTKNSMAGLVTATALVSGVVGTYFIDATLFEGLVGNVVAKLSLFEQFYELVNGVFDITALVYFTTVAGFFLFLSVQSMEKRRWSE